MFYNKNLNSILKSTLYYFFSLAIFFLIYFANYEYSFYVGFAWLLLCAVYKKKNYFLYIFFLLPIFIFDILYSNIFLSNFKLPILTVIFVFSSLLLIFAESFLYKNIRKDNFKYEI